MPVLRGKLGGFVVFGSLLLARVAEEGEVAVRQSLFDCGG